MTEPTLLANGLAERLRELLVHRGLRQKDVAAALAVDASYISQLLAGKKEPSQLLLIALCCVFGVSRRWLERGEGPMDDPGIRRWEPKRIRTGGVPPADSERIEKLERDVERLRKEIRSVSKHLGERMVREAGDANSARGHRLNYADVAED